MKKRKQCSEHCKAIMEMRELLREMDQKLSLLIEQNRVERDIFFRNEDDIWDGDDD